MIMYKLGLTCTNVLRLSCTS